MPQTKAELLLAIDKNFSKLISYLNTIPPEITSDKSMDGHAKGTEMSVRDLVSYLLGWNALVVKWIASDAKGLPVDLPETGYKWNQLGLLAQKFYSDYSELSYELLVAELQTVKDVYKRQYLHTPVLLRQIARQVNCRAGTIPYLRRTRPGRCR